MLEYLFKSETRKSILIHLYGDMKNKGLHLRGLSRVTHEHIYSIQREIQNLQKLGLLISEKQFNRTNIKLNINHPFYYDILRMIHKDSGLGALVIKSKKKLIGTKYAILTHHYLYKNRKEKYDIDLLLVGQPNVEITNTLVQNAEQVLDQDILYSIINSDEFNDRKSQQDSFIWNILKQTYIILIGNEAQIMV